MKYLEIVRVYVGRLHHFQHIFDIPILVAEPYMLRFLEALADQAVVWS